jgi:hypothetical protein
VPFPIIPDCDGEITNGENDDCTQKQLESEDVTPIVPVPPAAEKCAELLSRVKEHNAAPAWLNVRDTPPIVRFADLAAPVFGETVKFARLVPILPPPAAKSESRRIIQGTGELAVHEHASAVGKICRSLVSPIAGTLKVGPAGFGKNWQEP